MPPLHEIAHLAHVELRTPVLDESVAFFTDHLGLSVNGEAGDSIDRLVEGTGTHARRRADETAAATQQLTELGVPPRVSAAAGDLLAALRDTGSLGAGGREEGR
jgi:catechol 2,3-dioxygenase-like lactoylglutathione lyase family enzyme